MIGLADLRVRSPSVFEETHSSEHGRVSESARFAHVCIMIAHFHSFPNCSSPLVFGACEYICSQLGFHRGPDSTFFNDRRLTAPTLI